MNDREVIRQISRLQDEGQAAFKNVEAGMARLDAQFLLDSPAGIEQARLDLVAAFEAAVDVKIRNQRKMKEIMDAYTFRSR